MRDGFPLVPVAHAKCCSWFPGAGPWEKNPREHAVKVCERLAWGISGFGQDAAMRRT